MRRIRDLLDPSSMTDQADHVKDQIQRAGVRVDRGQNAALVLENPAFTEAFEGLRLQIIHDLSEVDLGDQPGQLLLLQQLKLIDRVYANLVSFVNSGKMAAAEITSHRKALEAELERMRTEESALFSRQNLMRQVQKFRKAA